MNNNKKYKKWSLGLVAPALVLAPIAVVASCSSSGEEKEAYGIEFKATQIRAKIHNATQPNDLTDEQFKEEVLNHLDELFTVTGKLPADDFISKNIEIGELQKNNDKKEVSAKVKVNNANTDGNSIEETITLTGLGYEEVDLTKKEYTIALKNNGAEEFPLNNQGGNSVQTITDLKLMGLIVANRDKYLTISGTNAADITNEVLTNQILTTESINRNKTTGKIKFTLKVSNPVNGKGNPLTKEITFTGFKKEVDTDKGVETTVNASVSTVTLGLNGNADEVEQQKNELNSKWIFDNKHAFFKQGDELITDETAISVVVLTKDTSKPTEMTLTFKVVEGKWYGQDGTINKTDKKDFTIKIVDLSSDVTAKKTLSLKFDASNPMAITKIEPRLSGITREQAKEILKDKEFIFKYMKHFLTGDFRFVTESDTIETFFKNDITVTEEGDDVLNVSFEIAEQKTVENGTENANTNTVQISLKLNGFTTTK